MDEWQQPYPPRRKPPQPQDRQPNQPYPQQQHRPPPAAHRARHSSSGRAVAPILDQYTLNRQPRRRTWPLWTVIGLSVVGVFVAIGACTSPITTTTTSGPAHMPAPTASASSPAAAETSTSPAGTPTPSTSSARVTTSKKATPTTKPAPLPPPKPPAPRPGCDPNYTGCVPIAADVDCQGGTGNGPAYVKGPVRVIGTDIYGLDADKDGIGCE